MNSITLFHYLPWVLGACMLGLLTIAAVLAACALMCRTNPTE